ncbi:conserved hypothetical protein [Escherichia coli]|nr:conserved hypothetical protein [Escherichia coli]
MVILLAARLPEHQLAVQVQVQVQVQV